MTLASYTGAKGRIAPDTLDNLDPDKYIVQPKFDGMYVEIQTDDLGKVSLVMSRAGRVLQDSLHGLTGERLSLGESVLCGELTAHTPPGKMMAKHLGRPHVFLFDAVSLNSRHLADVDYEIRLQNLWSTYSQLQELADGRTYDNDARGRGHDRLDGRFTVRKHKGWRVAHIVPSTRPGTDDYFALREQVDSNPWQEGLVVCRRRSRIGARGAKLKAKRTDTLDCRVVSRGGNVATLEFAGTTFRVANGRWDVTPGDIVEVSHEGFYLSDATPRFPRIKSIRTDLL